MAPEELGLSNGVNILRKMFGPVLASLVVAVWMADTATAQSFVGGPNSSFVLDLDSDDGAFSSWSVDDLSGLNALEARVTFLRKGKHKQWAPTFSIALGDDDTRAWLKVMALPQTDKLLMGTKITHADHEETLDIFIVPPEFGEEFELHIDWLPDGKVIFIVSSKAAKDFGGSERHEVQLERPPSTLSISGSTGEVLFNPIKLGRMGLAVAE